MDEECTTGADKGTDKKGKETDAGPAFSMVFETSSANDEVNAPDVSEDDDVAEVHNAKSYSIYCGNLGVFQ